MRWCYFWALLLQAVSAVGAPTPPTPPLHPPQPRVRVGADGVERLSVQCRGSGGEGEEQAAAAGHFPTIQAARDALRRHRQREGAGGSRTSEPTTAVVHVSGRCTAAVELHGPQDAGVTYVGHPSATISGGMPLPASELGPVRDPALLERLAPSARGLVQQLNLSALGLTPELIGKLGPHYYPGGNAQIDFFKFLPVGAAELFWAGQPLHRARWPNADDDQLLIPQNSMGITRVDRPGGGGLETNHVQQPRSQNSGNPKIGVAGPAGASARGGPAPPPPAPVGAARLGSWAAEIAEGRELWAHGEWSGNGWSDTHKPVRNVSAAEGTVKRARPSPPSHPLCRVLLSVYAYLGTWQGRWRVVLTRFLCGTGR
jgi:hypothetical protein